MKTYARIDGGIVAEIIELPDDIDAGSAFHPSMEIVACPENISAGWTYNGKKFSAPAAIAVDLTTYAAATRFAVETGGISVGGVQIATDRDSQAMVNGAWTYLQTSGAESVSYKAATGFVTLDADTLKAIALAVGSHVQACFALEAVADTGIADGSITTPAEVDAIFAEISRAANANWQAIQVEFNTGKPAMGLSK